MGDQKAWVTLATNDSYCLGALVLAHSLRRVGTKYSLVVLVTPGVTPIMRERLSTVFSEIVVVDVLDSQDAAHLALLARPELGITFTKLHCWTLVQYSKCVFLDADTMVLQNCDELFDREELSAAPDVGWPDCFNSGVFVYKPSNETFQALLTFAKEKGSFDGGDQGLLNSFFSDWAFGDIRKHLPFLYNVCSTSFYSYLPALKQFGSEMKIIHFIGNLKPWLQSFNWKSRTVNEAGHLQVPLQHWWNIFLDNVHPTLDVAMDRWECGAQDSNVSHYNPPIEPDSQFPWHRNPQSVSERPESPHQNHTEHFHDPWDYYTPAPTEMNKPNDADRSTCFEPNYIEMNNIEIEICNYSLNEIEQNNEEIVVPKNCIENNHEEIFVPPVYVPKPWYERNHYEDDSAPDVDESLEDYNYSATDDSSKTPNCEEDEMCADEDYEMIRNEETSISPKPQIEVIRPRHPYDNYYLLHQVVVGHDGCKRCSHEPPPPAPSPSPVVELFEEVDQELQAGVAGALSQMAIGSGDQSPGVEEHLRRQGWEAGNIDYMGADSFDNIWAKISSTLSGSPQPAPASPPAPEEPAACPLPPKAEVAVCPMPPKPEEAPVCPMPPKAEVAVCPMPPKAEAPACPMPPKAEAPACPMPPKPEVAVCPMVKPVAKPESPAESQPTEAAPAEPAAKSQEKDGDVCARPKEKLLCHLKPAPAAETVLTPDSEHEDAATIAQKIIASEEAVSSPIITSPTPPVTAPTNISSTPIPQDKKILSVDTDIPNTPPVPGPVSLAQIGIVSRETEEKKPVESPKEEKELCELKKAPAKKPQAPMPKAKSLESASSEVNPKKEGPVPPPRKKEKKPKK